MKKKEWIEGRWGGLVQDSMWWYMAKAGVDVRRILWEFLKNPIICQHLPHQCQGTKKHKILRYSNTLEILACYSVSWEWLDFTQSHTISLEVFFTGLYDLCRVMRVILCLSKS